MKNLGCALYMASRDSQSCAQYFFHINVMTFVFNKGVQKNTTGSII